MPRTAPQPSELLRFATAGSVDDGKSTLIGRLLYDTKAIFEDQLDAGRARVRAPPRRRQRQRSTSRCSPTACAPSASRASRSTSPTATSRRRGAASSSPTPPATSATRATWSPARRPPTSRSSSSTRATASSSSRAATRSSRRCCASPTSSSASTRWTSSTATRPRSTRSSTSSRDFAAQLEVPDVDVHPDQRAARRQRRRALRADALVRRPAAALPPRARPHRVGPQPASTRASRSSGSSGPATDEHHDYRGYAGQVAGGVLRPGDEVVVLPSGARSRVAAIDTFDGAGRRGVPADVGDGPPRGRPRRLARRRASAARTTARCSSATSTRWSAG